MDHLCTVCINQKSQLIRILNLNLRDLMKTEKKQFTSLFDLQKQFIRVKLIIQQKWRRFNKICQGSISFINQLIDLYKQYIELQIGELINLFQEKQNLLYINQTNIFQKQDFYQDQIQQVEIIAVSQLEQYEDDKIMDFGNIKILIQEIKNFGKRIVKKLIRILIYIEII
ncbi:unnamed protein product [Paramecium sonneborni]|uniref:Uncharacterized protein n=1 Tax=Paramecium sonneborni TaxID=65129 RepID=A0A8S1K6H4_9CILI|nr:unnamed protein product [Paramecium sonneborni]